MRISSRRARSAIRWFIRSAVSSLLSQWSAGLASRPPQSAPSTGTIFVVNPILAAGGSPPPYDPTGGSPGTSCAGQALRDPNHPTPGGPDHGTPPATPPTGITLPTGEPGGAGTPAPYGGGGGGFPTSDSVKKMLETKYYKVWKCPNGSTSPFDYTVDPPLRFLSPSPVATTW